MVDQWISIRLVNFLKLMYGFGGGVDSPMPSWVLSLCNAGSLQPGPQPLWFWFVINTHMGLLGLFVHILVAVVTPCSCPVNQSQLYSDKLLGTGIACVSKTLDWITIRNVNNTEDRLRHLAYSPNYLLTMHIGDIHSKRISRASFLRKKIPGVDKGYSRNNNLFAHSFVVLLFSFLSILASLLRFISIVTRCSKRNITNHWYGYKLKRNEWEWISS